jgi:hypothetical protein
MKLINLTQYSINIILDDGSEISIPSSGFCRVAAVPQPVTFHLETDQGHIPVAPAPVFGPVQNLPDEQKDVGIVVSLITAQAIMEQFPDRKDIFSLGTGPGDNCKRNEKGDIVAVTRLRHVHRG